MRLYINVFILSTFLLCVHGLSAQLGYTPDRGQAMTEADVGKFFAALTMLPQNENVREEFFNIIQRIMQTEKNFYPIYIKLISIKSDLAYYAKEKELIEKDAFLILTQNTKWRFWDERVGFRGESIAVPTTGEFDVYDFGGWLIFLVMDKNTKKISIRGSGVAN